MTTKDIILKYLKHRMAEGVSVVSSIHIELNLPEYGRLYWNTTKLPSAYSRVWRKIRENHEYREIGIKELIEIKNENLTKIWQIKV